MATLADELLNDFEDPGSEHEDNANGFKDGEEAHGQLPIDEPGNGALGGEADGDDEHMEDAEEEQAATDPAGTEAVDDEDDTKAKIEKMRLGGVRDVRSVAGLMKTLQPVLDVSTCPFSTVLCQSPFGLHKEVATVLTVRPLFRESPITRISHPISGRRLWDRSKTIPSTTC